MSEGVDTLEVGSQTTTPTQERVSIYNPFPEERREAMSPEEKFKRWIKEQGERDRQAAQLMRESKKQKKTRIA